MKKFNVGDVVKSKNIDREILVTDSGNGEIFSGRVLNGLSVGMHKNNLLYDCFELKINNTVKKTEFVKHDSEKPRMELIPPRSLLKLGSVLGFGAKKYSANNWKKCEDSSRYIGAASRHIEEYKIGKRADDETGINPLAHAIASLMFALELDEMKKEGLSKTVADIQSGKIGD